MEVTMNHKQYLDWKTGNKTLLDIKLENLRIKDTKEFTDELILGVGVTLFLTTNVMYMALGLEDMKLLGCILSTIMPSDYMELVKQCDYLFEFFSQKKKLNRLAVNN